MMQVLQRSDLDSLFNQGANTARGGVAGSESGDARDVVADGGAANGFFIVKGFAAEWSVDDQIDLAGLDEVDDVGAAFVYFEYAFGLDARSVQRGSGAARGGELKAERRELFADGGEMFFVAVVHAEKHATLAGQALARGELCFGKGLAVGSGNAHDFAGGAHLWTEDSIH